MSNSTLAGQESVEASGSPGLVVALAVVFVVVLPVLGAVCWRFSRGRRVEGVVGVVDGIELRDVGGLLSRP